MAINPIGMTLRDYADVVAGRLDAARLEGDDWRTWAADLADTLDLPDPYHFADWREWAMRAYPTFEEAGA